MYSKEIAKAFAKESANFCYKYTDKQLKTRETIIVCHTINYKYIKLLCLFVSWNLRLRYNRIINNCNYNYK